MQYRQYLGITRSIHMNILYIVNIVYKYRHVMPVLIEFIETVMRTSSDKNFTKEEQSELMKCYWKIIKAVKAN